MTPMTAPQEPAPLESLILLLLFDALPELVPNRIAQHLALFGPLQSPLQVSDHIVAEDVLHVKIAFDQHAFL